MTVTDPSAKVQIIPTGSIPIPGTCVVCAKSYDEYGFAAIGAFLEFYGEIMFCRDCSLQLIEAWGGLNPDEADELKDKLEITQALLSTVQAENEKLDESLGSIRHSLSVLGLNLSPVVASVETNPDEHSDSGERVGDVTESVSSGKSTDPKPRQSNKVPGPNDIGSAEPSDLTKFGF
jgi:hypothetical protein